LKAHLEAIRGVVGAHSTYENNVLKNRKVNGNTEMGIGKGLGKKK
jgi:hypothetical protein